VNIGTPILWLHGAKDDYVNLPLGSNRKNQLSSSQVPAQAVQNHVEDLRKQGVDGIDFQLEQNGAHEITEQQKEKLHDFLGGYLETLGLESPLFRQYSQKLR
jgi:predicted esterase